MCASIRVFVCEVLCGINSLYIQAEGMETHSHFQAALQPCICVRACVRARVRMFLAPAINSSAAEALLKILKLFI